MRFFPYDTPYDGQREAMDRIHNALTRGQDVLFEGACGTGKTMAALAPALHFAREENKTVVITTNVNQQARQFRREASIIGDTEPLRAVVFRGKGSMCHIDVDYEECQVLRDNTRELVEQQEAIQELEDRLLELEDRAAAGEDAAIEDSVAIESAIEEERDEINDLAERTTCDYYERNLTAHTDEFYQWLFEDVRKPGEIYEYAHGQGYCGYELLKEGLDDVDLAICNYHHLLDQTIREQFFRWLDVDPAEVIVVFDEAHNVADTAREHATETLSEQTVVGALDELDEVTDSRRKAAGNVLEPFLGAIRTAYEESLPVEEREVIGDSWVDVPIANEDGRDDLTLEFLKGYSGPGIEQDLETMVDLGEHLDATYEEAYRNGERETRRECHLLTVATFLDRWLAEGGDMRHHPMVSVRRNRSSGELYARIELYACLPRTVTEELFGAVYGSILMSATLRPFDVLSDVLGLSSPATMAYDLRFPAENRQSLAVGTPPLFASDRNDPEVLEIITNTLADISRMIPGNVVVFFPNYSEAKRYANRLEDCTDAGVYLDRPGERAEELREEFTRGDNGMLCTSLWGTLTEGVSFDGDDAIGTVVVGVPYPHLDDRAQAVQRAYGRAFADRGVDDPGWHYAVEIPTVRKTRQALGRVIRSPTDIGTRILMDRRYTKEGVGDLGAYSVHETLPKELQDELVDVSPEKVKYSLLNFYTDHDAYDGDSPAP